MLLALGAVSLGWAAWVMWSSRATRWMRVCAPACVVLIAAVDAYWLWRVDALMTTTAADTPADRTQRLSDGLAQAYSVWGPGHAVALLLLVVMTALIHVRRARSRSVGTAA